MLTETFHSIAAATRTVFRSWRSMLLIAIVYAALLAALYAFIAVKEASITQVVLTFGLAIGAPLLFFILQAMIVGNASDEDGASVGSLLKSSLAKFWKLILVTLPLIALGVLVAYLLAKVQMRLGSPVPDTAAEIPRRLAEGAREPSKPIYWKGVMVSAVRYLTFGLILPIAAIHLWLAAARGGLVHALKRMGGLLARAFSARSILVYLIGFIIFAVVPHLLLFHPISSKHAWLELSLLALRLAVIFVMTLFGWVITVQALALVWRGTPANKATNEAA